MGRDLRVPACRERGLQRIAPRGEGETPSPVPSPMAIATTVHCMGISRGKNRI